jgi:thiol-disulfide isomerase/thioredoxin
MGEFVMAAVESRMLALGTPAPAFALPDPDGAIHELRDGADAYLVMFICNHCPYVKHVRAELARIGDEYGRRNVAIYAINSNDVSTHPGDSPAMMKQEAKDWGYTFPYLYDAGQDIAKLYRAACTPDFFVFDSERKLVYRGQLDDSRPSNRIPVNGGDLRTALEAVLSDTRVTETQKPSIGCSIKWQPGNEPDYA